MCLGSEGSERAGDKERGRGKCRRIERETKRETEKQRERQRQRGMRNNREWTI